MAARTQIETYAMPPTAMRLERSVHGAQFIIIDAHGKWFSGFLGEVMTFPAPESVPLGDLK